MAQYFRIKEITAPATVLRQGNLLGIELGDFIYPDEVETIACASAITYWDDNTGEHFTWEPAVVKVAAPVAKPAAPAPKAPVVEENTEAPAAE